MILAVGSPVLGVRLPPPLLGRGLIQPVVWVSLAFVLLPLSPTLALAVSLGTERLVRHMAVRREPLVTSLASSFAHALPPGPRNNTGSKGNLMGFGKAGKAADNKTEVR
jgi:hypothetical protein